MTTQEQTRRGRSVNATVTTLNDGRGVKKMDDEVMHRLVQKGLTNADIVRWFAAQEPPQKVTASGVSIWKSRHGYPSRASTPERLALIPWRVKAEDARHRVYQALAAEARRRAGRELDEPTAKRRAKFMRELAETGTVIHYDTVNGWKFVRPRPGIDEDLIRDPRIADDGSPIDDPTKWQ